MNATSVTDTIIQEVVIKAPVGPVFDALTDPGQRIAWWGSEGRFQTTHMESDLRLGGKWMMSGLGVGGRPFQISGEYRQVQPPHLLVFTWLPSWQEDAIESIVRFELSEAAGVTTVRLTHSGLTTEGSQLSHKGWPEILTWLQTYAESYN
jgi:uncharacterized protein YndB with AHSA1/START domain